MTEKYAGAERPALPPAQPLPPLSCDSHLHVFGDPARFPDRNPNPVHRSREASFADALRMHGTVGFARLRKAVAAKDFKTLGEMMTPDFGYKLSPEATGSGVFKYWDENNLWPELDGILSEKFVKKGGYMVAPPQFADESLNYDGYRAGIRRINGSWKFVYFVNG